MANIDGYPETEFEVAGPAAPGKRGHHKKTASPLPKPLLSADLCIVPEMNTLIGNILNSLYSHVDYK